MGLLDGLGAMAPNLLSGAARGLVRGEQYKQDSGQKARQLELKRMLLQLEHYKAEQEAEHQRQMRDIALARQKLDEKQHEDDTREKQAKPIRDLTLDPDALTSYQQSNPQGLSRVLGQGAALGVPPPGGSYVPPAMGQIAQTPGLEAFLPTGTTSAMESAAGQVVDLPRFRYSDEAQAKIDYQKAGAGQRGAQEDLLQQKAATEAALRDPRMQLLLRQGDLAGARAYFTGEFYPKYLQGKLDQGDRGLDLKAEAIRLERERIRKTLELQGGELERKKKRDEWEQGVQQAKVQIARDVATRATIPEAQARTRRLRQIIEVNKGAFNQRTLDKIPGLIRAGYQWVREGTGPGAETMHLLGTGQHQVVERDKNGKVISSKIVREVDTPEGKYAIWARERLLKILGYTEEALKPGETPDLSTRGVFIPNTPQAPQMPATGAPPAPDGFADPLTQGPATSSLLDQLLDDENPEPQSSLLAPPTSPPEAPAPPPIKGPGAPGASPSPGLSERDIQAVNGIIDSGQFGVVLKKAQGAGQKLFPVQMKAVWRKRFGAEYPSRGKAGGGRRAVGGGVKAK